MPGTGSCRSSVVGASAVWSTHGLPSTVTVRPSAWRSRSSRVPALKSTAPAAQRLVDRIGRRVATVLTAQSTGRPRSLAMAVMDAMASFMTLAPSVPSMSWPWLPTGDAAPMLVPGAIAARLPARVMKVPALAARAPAGATHTMTGSGAVEQRLDDVVGRVERAAGRVQLDDHGRRAVLGGAGDAVMQVARHDLVDDARGRQHHHGARSHRRGPSARQRRPTARRRRRGGRWTGVAAPR